MNSTNLPTTPKSVELCALYDAASGRIVHVHRVETYAGAKKTSKAHIEERCLKIAKQLGHETSSLKTLHVPHTKFKKGIAYKVDVKTRKLKSVPRRPLKQIVTGKK
jgi:hypothetical protein